MLKLIKFPLNPTTANQSKITKYRCHLKNMVNPKNHKSKEETLVLVIFFIAAFIAASSLVFVGCFEKEESVPFVENRFSRNGYDG